MIAALLVAVVSAFVATGVSAWLLSAAGVWDVSNARSSHRGRVVRGGGVGLLVGALASVVWAIDDVTPELLVIIATVVVMAGVGMADDIRSLPVGPRLALQAVIAVIAVATLLTPYEATWWSVLLLSLAATAWVIGFVNVFNFMDGINGISLLVTVAAGSVYAAFGLSEGHETLAICSLALVGAATGALPWNAPRPRVFLGDVGSYGIGSALGLLALACVLNGATLVLAVAPLAIYCADTGWALARKLIHGQPWWAAHRDHVYQRLVDSHGFSHVQCSLLVAVASCLLGVVALLLPWPLALAIIVAAAICYLWLPAVLPVRTSSIRS